MSKRLFGDTGKTVQVWDANTGQPLATYSGHKGHVRAIAWSPDGRRIASASDDKTVQIWDASTGQHLISHKGRAGAIAWSPDGWRIASANGVVQIWDARTGQDLITYQEGGVRDLAWSPDGQHLILQGSLTTVLEVDTGHRINSIDTGAGFELLGWAPDGQHYAYRLRGSVYVDSVGRSGHAMYPYQGLLVDIAWVLNGWRIALVSYDGAVQVW